MDYRFKLFVIAAIFLIACTRAEQRAEGSAPAEQGASRQLSKNPSAQSDRFADRLGSDRLATLQALATGHSALVQKLGAHRLTSTSELSREVAGAAAEKVVQHVSLQVNAKGHYSATKTTDPHFGREVIWTGQWLFTRLRHSWFVKRELKDAAEPQRIAQTTFGLLPAYVELLGRFISFRHREVVSFQGRRAVKLKLGLAKTEGPAPQERAVSRKWRERVTARKLEGSVIFCEETGAPLKVDLAAQWRFVPPAADKIPETGIPTKFSKDTVGLMTLDFSQNISQIGQEPVISEPDPSEVDEAIRRVRLEIERQMLTGERPLSGRVTGRVTGQITGQVDQRRPASRQ